MKEKRRRQICGKRRKDLKFFLPLKTEISFQGNLILKVNQILREPIIWNKLVHFGSHRCSKNEPNLKLFFVLNDEKM